MPKHLVIVESPAKARTISGYLGPDFVVESSVGHIRDLPDSAAEIPEKYKGESWARLGVDVEHGFEPDLVPIPGIHGNELDPTADDDGVQCKTIIDATLDAAARERYVKVTYPAVDLASYLGGAL